jgi:hypothetical protein
VTQSGSSVISSDDETFSMLYEERDTHVVSRVCNCEAVKIGFWLHAK